MLETEVQECSKCGKLSGLCSCNLQGFVTDLLQIQESKTMCAVCDKNEADKHGVCSDCMKAYGLKKKGESFIVSTALPSLNGYDPSSVDSKLAEILEEELEEKGYEDTDDPDFKKVPEDFDDDLDEFDDEDEEDEEDDDDMDWDFEEDDEDEEDEDWDE